jgi:hypothetical protein
MCRYIFWGNLKKKIFKKMEIVGKDRIGVWVSK